MPLNETSGNVTSDAYGGGVAAKVNYIENYFQTWLRTGTGASTTVTTGLDASTNKALVWTKSRSAATDHKLTDTVRGATKALISDTTGAQTTDTNGLTAFSSTGYTIGTDTNYNNSGATYVDWEFVAAPKFFDVVTYTGTGSAQNISHNLGSVPGCVIVKSTSNTTTQWYTYHRSTGNTGGMFLSLTNAFTPSSSYWDNTDPTSTQFTVGTGGTNNSGQTYVAYIFAHNAGGFGLTGTDNVISCGSFTDTSGAINLGYEPQYLLYKCSSGASDWTVIDTMRGLPGTGATTQQLYPNTSGGEAGGYSPYITSTGFYVQGVTAGTYIYIAIRRGPMKVPTDATKVFKPVARSGTGSAVTITGVGFTPSLSITENRTSGADWWNWYDRLRGKDIQLSSNSTSSEINNTNLGVAFDVMDGVKFDGNDTANNASGNTYANYFFQRAPSFFDEVCYTGTGSTNYAVTHNLGIAPELMIVRFRNLADNWYVYSKSAGGAGTYLVLNSTNAIATGVTNRFPTDPTSTQFYVGNALNSGSYTSVAYLFATCAGVSKVGNYTGTGATQTINCGFTGGARFVLVKRTDSTGDWYVWDTARGMVSGTDPSLLLNSTAAEVNANSIYTTTGGFQIVSTDAGINASGGSYIYFSVA